MRISVVVVLVSASAVALAVGCSARIGYGAPSIAFFVSVEREWPRASSAELAERLAPFPSPWFGEVRGADLAELFTTRHRHASERGCVFPDPNDRAWVSCHGAPLIALPAPAREVATDRVWSREEVLLTCCVGCGPSGHSCALLETGEVACWGYGNMGQLGDGSRPLEPRATPVVIEGLTDVVDIDVSSTHTCAVDESGDVFCWGSNLEGQLGDGTDVSRARPVRVLGLDVPAVAVELGADHSCALLADGGVACWGSPVGAGLPDGATTARRLPTARRVVAILAAEDMTCVIDDRGDGQCGGRIVSPTVWGEPEDRARVDRIVAGASGGFPERSEQQHGW